MKPQCCYGPLGAPLFSKLSFGYQKSRGRSHALLLMNMGFVFRKRVWKKYSKTPTHQTNNTNVHPIFIQKINFVKIDVLKNKIFVNLKKIKKRGEKEAPPEGGGPVGPPVLGDGLVC